MLLNIINLNNKLIDSQDEISGECLDLIRQMGAFIPCSEIDINYLKKQNQLIQKHQIYKHLFEVKNYCQNLLRYDDGEHNLYIVTLNPNYTFALKTLQGVLAYNKWNNTYLLINLSVKDGKHERLSSIFAHEYHHVIRNQHLKDFPKRKKILLDYVIEEGLAENFVSKVFDENSLNPWAKQSTPNEIIKYRDYLKKNLNEDKTEIIYSALYGDQVAGIPLWIGYSFGYYFIKYILNNENTNIDYLTKQSREYFKSFISDFFSYIYY
ncbi:DUF2268 domain-containing protein [Virgibacillus pantothenticus]|uniref:DUF2268 domain-containing putative Zn-dependent protease n=1 Tax=Virgibacillus pantothenticus TaxID=1473 RepID=UPI001C2133C7|nr:DUF2268 domain-containing putative Zn-dependent protease [Virgibacillus pantothenticus]MBU8567678.1 DUF2268 domain-containing protein [Virgibacillus pantothenticus]MBU8602068.1 DUF2268 domain-containing protein [Virgibacillus pantothenticus]MBU8635705.1 DUF2268 domain-containing protein [Virgibacillus pantothenticus]MBU8643912.1 DUF2268 domain-containing protein [Virgibacillus pantothenticus]MBU8648216.1 DUF2268 domain-containing protein [Virgibacillus pantothenticus]